MTKKEMVYDSILEKIKGGKLRAGTPMDIISISTELNVSATPVREALLLLRNEGYLEMRPGIGLSVAEVKLEDMVEIYEIRDGLDLLAMDIFMRKQTKADVQQLQECYDKQVESMCAGDMDIFAKEDIEFHYIIARGTRNRRLMKILDSVYVEISRMSGHIRSDKDQQNRSVEEHKRILEAVKRGDASEAKEAVNSHCRAGKEFFVKRL